MHEDARHDEDGQVRDEAEHGVGEVDGAPRVAGEAAGLDLEIIRPERRGGRAVEDDGEHLRQVAGGDGGGGGPDQPADAALVAAEPVEEEQRRHAAQVHGGRVEQVDDEVPDLLARDDGRVDQALEDDPFDVPARAEVEQRDGEADEGDVEERRQDEHNVVLAEAELLGVAARGDAEAGDDERDYEDGDDACFGGGIPGLVEI